MEKDKISNHKHPLQKTLSMVLLLFFTAIVIINNTTQLFQTYNIPLSLFNITLISVLGLFASMVWTIILITDWISEMVTLTSQQINIALGLIILILNLIPLFTNTKYFSVSLSISILLATIRILFL